MSHFKPFQWRLKHFTLLFVWEIFWKIFCQKKHQITHQGKKPSPKIPHAFHYLTSSCIEKYSLSEDTMVWWRAAMGNAFQKGPLILAGNINFLPREGVSWRCLGVAGKKFEWFKRSWNCVSGCHLCNSNQMSLVTVGRFKFLTLRGNLERGRLDQVLIEL